MKKILCCIISLCILISHMFMNTYAISYKSAKEAIDDANDFLLKKMDYENYYLLQIDGMDINDKLAQYGLDVFSNRPVFVYGDNIQASKKTTSAGRDFVKKVNGKDEYRALGYAIDGSVFPNPVFPHDNEGYAAEDKMWVKEPWLDGTKVRYLCSENGTVVEKTLSNNVLEYINKWIKFNYFHPDHVKVYTGERNYFVKNAVDVPEKLKDNFEDFLYIIQPPTEHAWGLGIAFYYWNGYNNLNYRSFLIKPFDMDEKDLDVSFSNIPGSTTEGKKVLIGVKVKSHFNTDLKGVNFKWNITTKNSDGKSIPLNADIYGLEFGGSSGVQSGSVDILARYKEECFYAEFTMPSSDVYVEFVINEDGKNPLESNVENNTVSTVIKPEKPVNLAVKKYDLPYYALSREIRYPLANEDIIFNFNKPSGASWSGNGKVNTALRYFVWVNTLIS
ncbi:Athe_2463 domain-containing protein [Acetivibrio straminisolvens]|uniref:Athe_2463 domain-containing protein n=1 Tax=Acetivibrio straminisolvens TaxID=253314 RepID=UPI00224004C3|nr:hypothetical protein [Acetivibrio straminisolvens]